MVSSMLTPFHYGFTNFYGVIIYNLMPLCVIIITWCHDVSKIEKIINWGGWGRVVKEGGVYIKVFSDFAVT